MKIWDSGSQKLGKLYVGGLEIEKTYTLFRLDTNDNCNPPVTAKLGDHDICYLAGYEAQDVGKVTNPSLECYTWPEGLPAISTYTSQNSEYPSITTGSSVTEYKPTWRARADVDGCTGTGSTSNSDPDVRCNFLCVDFE